MRKSTVFLSTYFTVQKKRLPRIAVFVHCGVVFAKSNKNFNFYMYKILGPTYVSHGPLFYMRYGTSQCCGSASLWCESGFDLSPDADPVLIVIWCGSVCGFLFDADADPDPTFHPDADPHPYTNPSFQIKAQTPGKSAQIGSYSIHFGLSSANWCGSGCESGSSLLLWCGSGSWF